MRRPFTGLGIGARKVALWAVAAGMALAAPARAEGVDALLVRVFAAYGGADRLAAVQRLHATGITSSLRTGTAGPSERWFVRPDKLRIDIRHAPAHVESRILDGELSWKDGVAVKEPFRSAMVLQAARFGLPLILARLSVTDRGELVEGDRTLRVLSAALPGGMRLEAMIDPVTARIERSRGIVSFGGQEAEFATAYGDFRRVDGILFAHREEHFAMGVRTGETVLLRIELNPAIAPAVFRP